jgi:hypothetical protein
VTDVDNHATRWGHRCGNIWADVSLGAWGAGSWERERQTCHFQQLGLWGQEMVALPAGRAGGQVGGPKGQR